MNAARTRFVQQPLPLLEPQAPGQLSLLGPISANAEVGRFRAYSSTTFGRPDSCSHCPAVAVRQEMDEDGDALGTYCAVHDGDSVRVAACWEDAR